MKLYIIAAIVAAATAGRLESNYLPPSGLSREAANAPIQILHHNNDNRGDGNYIFEYETANHIAQKEIGEIKNLGTNQQSNVVRGFYSYTAPDGVTYTVNYNADENGFHASGDHIPKPSPEILRSLELNSADASQSSENSFGSFSGTHDSISTPLAPQYPQYISPQYGAPEIIAARSRYLSAQSANYLPPQTSSPQSTQYLPPQLNSESSGYASASTQTSAARSGFSSSTANGIYTAPAHRSRQFPGNSQFIAALSKFLPSASQSRQYIAPQSSAASSGLSSSSDNAIYNAPSPQIIQNITPQPSRLSGSSFVSVPLSKQYIPPQSNKPEFNGY